MTKVLIIGGLGPQASLLLHRLLIDYAAEMGAIANHDYPEVLHLSIPVQDFISDENHKEAAMKRLVASLECLWRRFI